ncbi:General transcription factor IIF subunit 2 [Morus notabilis]|uniref:General transcription factor IIF subunit 2 n=1 Tax=Morus notabilis TaxID=981085 RepID=W9RAR2_9ROSA|nr:general transcription factor IIF subunit 2 [Morus notabilis]EXB80108.1 General transcription factor IIF subunit 2 [Morus notabilis]
MEEKQKQKEQKNTTDAATATVTATSYNEHNLDTSKAERAVWLLKCPPIVSRSLQKSPYFSSSSSCDSSSLPIAKVVLSIDPLNPSDATKFTMELDGTESGNSPKSYCMDMYTDFVPMSVFSESSKGNLSVEGKILHKFDMKPHDDNIENYGKLCRERTKQYMTRMRQIKVIDNDNGARMRPMPGMLSIASDKKKMTTKGSDTRRIRRDRREMEEIMFKLFERQPNRSLRQLIHETDQPEQFLKELLKDLCVYNNKGANQGTYELKPEYRKSNE